MDHLQNNNLQNMDKKHAIIPNTVILATAYAISLFWPIIGPVAIIAVVPQTVLPIAIKYDILLKFLIS